MMGWGGHVWWWILWPVVLGVLGWLAWTALRGTRGFHDGESPEEILRRRFADGEIDEPEYRERLSTLRRSGRGASRR